MAKLEHLKEVKIFQGNPQSDALDCIDGVRRFLFDNPNIAAQLQHSGITFDVRSHEEETLEEANKRFQEQKRKNGLGLGNRT